MATVGMLLPQFSIAQASTGNANSLHGVLNQLYQEMLPLCSRLIRVGQGIAGFAATWYIATRVWKHIANAEPVDFYPLFRPFVIGFAVMIFPSVLSLINSVMQPTVTATAEMVKGSDKAIGLLLQQKEQAIKNSPVWQMYVGETGSGDREKWYKYTHDNSEAGEEGAFEGIGNDIKFAMSKASYNFRNSIKQWMSEVLQVLFEAAALCINTLRTFQLIVLAILGPLVFGIAVFDGFHHTITVWIARYINIFLWLPVANIFGSIIGKIQEKMLVVDISQVENYGDTFFSPTDVAYLVFLVIGIVGYFTVPSVSNYIVHASGGNAMVHKVTSLFSNTTNSAISSASAGAGMISDAMGNAAGRMTGSMSSHGGNEGYFSGSGSSGTSSFSQDKLSGKTSS
jgi:conjugative transposon TraJ protein